MIISNKALKKIKEIYSGNIESIVVFSMKETGCTGFEFIMTLKNNKDNIILENHSNIIIGIDSKYKEQFENTMLDYTEDKLESKFVFTNSNIKSYCGCGQSFNF